MGFYDAWLFPRVLDLVMQQKQMVPFRERIGKAASGRVLDIGIGSGLNLPFYGEQADHVCGVDPSAELLKFAQERAHKAHVPVEFLRGSGEALPLDDKSIDTVVMTFTLCTVNDAARTLAEIRRASNPGASFASPNMAAHRKSAWLDGRTGSRQSGSALRVAAISIANRMT
jgi:ubiquinone/menaquinone biosynthesis C-methylase UbiE